MEELYDPEPVQESAIDLSEGSFIVKLPNCGYLNINPEYGPNGVTTGRFHIYFADPVHGTSTFYVEVSDDMEWTSEMHPPFVDEDFIRMIGEKIESRDA